MPIARAIARAARAYFEFAARAIAPPGPAFVAVGGLSGTGKSVLARMLAPAVGADARAPSSCAPTSSAKRFSGWAKPRNCRVPPTPTRSTPAFTPRSATRLAASSPPGTPSLSTRCSQGRRSAPPLRKLAKSARLAAAGAVPHGRHRDQAGPRRGPRPRCLRCRCGRGAGAGALRTGPPGMGEDRCLRDAGSHPGPRQGSPAPSLID